MDENRQALDADEPELQLRVSQNPLVSPVERISLLKGVFLLYFMTFIPSLLLVALWRDADCNNNFTAKFLIIVLISGAGFLALSFALSYSKIAARKWPYNYIMFVSAVLFLAVANRALLDLFGNFVLIALLYLLFNAAGLLIYVLFSSTEFKMFHGMAFGLGAVLVPFMFSMILFRSHLVQIFAGLAAVVLILMLIVYTTQLMVHNRSFMMLPDDYIMGAMRIITIIPLIPDIFASDGVTGDAPEDILVPQSQPISKDEPNETVPNDDTNPIEN